MPAPPVALLPLDDRPCNRLFPARLAAIAGRMVRTPPLSALGHFLDPGDPERLLPWLQSRARTAVGVVVSVDMLCYGGLIASRSPAVSADIARVRLEALRAARVERPDLPLLAFGVIARLGTTVTSPEVARLHHDLVEYSILRDRAERLGEPEATRDLGVIASRIGPERLEQYLAMRRRNHEINLALVRLVGEGVVDFAVLSQEDAAPTGLHRGEQEALQAEISRLGVADRVLIYPGADEVASVLVARLLAPGRRVRALYATAGGAEVVARYEDRPLRETVAGQVAGAGAVPTEDEPDLVLAVNTPRGEQVEAEEALEADPRRAGLAPFLDEIGALVHAGTPVALADCAYANGGDPALVAGLAERGLAARLAGYAGWNTAGNAVGTALAQAILCTLGRQDWSRVRAHACARFTFERLVDDFAWQSLSRRYAYHQAAAERVSPFHLGDAAERFQGLMRELLVPQAEVLFDRHFLGRTLHGDYTVRTLDRLRLRLPWPRLFEVEVRAALGLGEVRVTERTL